MSEILWVNSSVRGWYIRTHFVYTTNFGKISEPISNMNELSEIGRMGGNLYKFKSAYHE